MGSAVRFQPIVGICVCIQFMANDGDAQGDDGDSDNHDGNGVRDGDHGTRRS